MKSYAAWCRKQGRTAQCSPALGVVGILIVFAITVYIYRQVILTTIIDAVLAAVGVAVFVGALAVTISTIRWYRKKAAAERAGAATELMPLPAWPTTDADAAAISREADWLAAEGVELAFSPDGKTLKVKEGK